VVPLGNLNPPGHTTPSDHIYFYFAPTSTAWPVYAPGAGTVDGAFTHGGVDSKLDVVAAGGDGLRYYIDHVVLDAGIGQGSVLAAGQRVGTTSASSQAVDLGLVNPAVSRTFAAPARYIADSLHADAPLPYFEEPVRSQLYAKAGSPTNPDGKFDYDRTGKLVGNWYLQGLPADQSSGPSGWGDTLAFVYDDYDPTQVRISVGGVLAGAPWVAAVLAGAPDPKDVTLATGKVAYRLANGNGFGGTPSTTEEGLLIVQMQDESTIEVEAFWPSQASDASFDASAQIYTR
jgi:hypothetical protein